MSLWDYGGSTIGEDYGWYQKQLGSCSSAIRYFLDYVFGVFLNSILYRYWYHESCLRDQSSCKPFSESNSRVSVDLNEMLLLFDFTLQELSQRHIQFFAEVTRIIYDITAFGHTPTDLSKKSQYRAYLNLHRTLMEINMQMHWNQ